MSSSRISVVIPLYNKEKYVVRAIKSVLAQTISDFELIIVDDGSNDSSVQKIRKITDHRIKIIQQKNSGVSAARNRGIRESVSEIIAFLDADDEWEKHHAETILELVNDFPSARMYSTAFMMKSPDDSGSRSHNLFNLEAGSSKHVSLKDYLSVALIEDFPLHTICTAFHRSVFEKVGYFRLDESFGEDADMFLRVLLQFPMAYCNKITANYYLNSENSLCTYHNETFNVKNASLITIKEELEKNSIQDKQIINLLNEYLLLLTIDYSKHLSRGKQRWKAVKELSSIRTTKQNLNRKIYAYIFIVSPEKIKRLWYILRRLIREDEANA